MAEPLFSVRGLKVALPDMTRKPLFGRAPKVEILKGLDFDLPRNSVTGIVGESGSGKSTLGRALVRLIEPSAGSVVFDGRDITHLPETELRPLRRDLQMIFQDPMSSLNPRRTIAAIIAAPLKQNGMSDNLDDRVAEALKRVGLPESFGERYRHELSGGQRQRVGIARALALSPKFVLADEIVSGLDVSTQAQILTLLEKLADEMGLTVAFISHDLSVVRRLCRQVIVMRNGEIVEAGPTDALFAAPEHAYTRELIAAIPLPEIDADWLDRAPAEAAAMSEAREGDEASDFRAAGRAGDRRASRSATTRRQGETEMKTCFATQRSGRHRRRHRHRIRRRHSRHARPRPHRRHRARHEAGGRLLHRGDRLQEGDVVRAVRRRQGHLHAGPARRPSEGGDRGDHAGALRLRVEHRAVQIHRARPEGRRRRRTATSAAIHIAFYVDDVAAAKAYLDSKGVATRMGPLPVNEGPAAGQTILYFQAPWGLQFEAISYPNGMAYEKDAETMLWSPKDPGEVASFSHFRTGVYGC